MANFGAEMLLEAVPCESTSADQWQVRDSTSRYFFLRLELVAVVPVVLLGWCWHP